MKKQPFDQNKAYRDFIKMQRDVGKKPKRTGGPVLPFTSGLDDVEMFTDSLDKPKAALSANHKQQFQHLPKHLKDIVEGFHDVIEKIVQFKHGLANRSGLVRTDPEKGAYMKANAQTNIGHEKAKHLFNELKDSKENYESETKELNKNFKYPKLRMPKVLHESSYPYYIMLKFAKKCVKNTYRVYACYLSHHNENTLTNSQKDFWMYYEEAKDIIKQLNAHKPKIEKKKRKPRKNKTKKDS